MTKAGSPIAHYEVLDEIGGGGMGVVYSARDTKLDRTVALKFLPPDLCRDGAAKERFTQEAKAASALNHPNICAIHDIRETDDGQLFIVMARYDGQTLKHYLEDGPVEESEAVRIVRQIAEGLSAAHEKGIVHRDIKPANIMVTEKGHAVILDFGLAKLAGGAALTITGSTLGTISYMSPEQAQATEVDHRADIWALGALMYEMLTGRKPFPGDFDQAVVYNILNIDPEPVSVVAPDLPVGFGVILQRALQKDRDLRYNSANDFLNDLDALTGQSELKSTGSGPIERSSETKRRLPVVLAVGVGLAIVAGLFFAWGPGKSDSIDSIAVLPLENLSGDPDQQYFVDGMTEAMITELSKIGGLKVISRQSAMRFRDSELAATEIADQLGVDALVQGSVIREGDDVRITAQLISGSTDDYLWADSFDRELRGILKLHGEVARAIADQIEINITAAERVRLSSAEEVDPRAYEFYLRGREHLYRLGPDDIEAAENYFDRALEIDPDFALAILGLTGVIIVKRQMGFIQPDVGITRIMELHERAFELDSTLSEVHASVAVFETWTNWNWEAGEKAFKRAIALNPNDARARAFYSHLLNILCRPDEAMEQIDRALELDPFNAFIRSLYANDLMFVGRFDEAIRQAQEVLKTSPSDFVAFSSLKASYASKEQYEQAYKIERRMKLARADSGLVEVLDKAYQKGGYVFAMGEVAKALVTRADTSFVSAFQIAAHFGKAGFDDETLVWLERAFTDHAVITPYMVVFGSFDGVRDDPRFDDLLGRMNLKACVQ